MSKNSVIIYVGNFDYPNGNAAGKRVYGNLEAMNMAGYKTACLCFRYTQGDGRVDRTSIGLTERFTIPYTSGFARLNKKAPAKAFKYVLDAYSDKEIKAVIMYNSLGTTDFNSFVIKECRRRNIKVFYDIVDYFDTPQKTRFLRYLMIKRELDRKFRKVLPKCDGWIAISSYLKEKMRDPSKVIIVPPLAVKRVEKSERIPSDTVTFSYATYIRNKNRAISEWKDRVDAYIDVFEEVRKADTKRKFFVNFLGFQKQELVDVFPQEIREEYKRKLDSLDPFIKYHGKMNNDDVQKVIEKSDFTILLRDSKTCNNAGFPTKVSESISLGVPVFANITSDIGDYIKDKVNGIVVPEPSDIDGIAQRMIEVLNMEENELQSLRDGASKTEGFYYESYAETFKNYFN
ncbi:MAG: glycosyltransferase family 4 protein [Clostridia bacterium]|nr:glycosyltransferase family 4 protein [Clostridia bacterium]